jgi:quercetin dioxygenase-like cupin family protein
MHYPGVLEHLERDTGNGSGPTGLPSTRRTTSAPLSGRHFSAQYSVLMMTAEGGTGGRLLITGVDGSGRSCVVQDKRVTLQGDASLYGVLYSVLYGTPSVPSIPDGGRAADALDLGVTPGAINWMMIEYAPGKTFSMHHTSTVDFDLVLSGSVELILDDGVHPLAPGDSVVVTGVDHAWNAGPDGCRLSVVAIGAAPSPELIFRINSVGG